MGKLIINRKKEWANRLKAYNLFIDGKQVGQIKNGEIKEFEIEDGAHQLEIQMGLCGSGVYNFEMLDGKNKMYQVSGFKHINWVNPLLGLTTVLAITYRRMAEKGVVNDEYGIFIIMPLVPLLLYFLYYITLGRKKYLRIRTL